MKEIRSILYVPAHNADWVESATTHGADAVILDLEDSVPVADKPRARQNITDSAASLAEANTVVTLRLNPYQSDWFVEDIDVIGDWLDAVVVPKVETGSELHAIEGVLRYAEHRMDIPHQIDIIPLVETAAGIYNAHDICTSSERVAAIGSGTSKGGDIQQSIDLGWSPAGDETAYIRSKVVLDAKAAGIDQILSGVWATVHDREGLREKALRQKRFGFSGMQVIHPGQVETVNEVFTPSGNELAYNQQLLTAFEQQQDDGQGVIEFDGEMVDAARVKSARRMLERANEFGVDPTEEE